MTQNEKRFAILQSVLNQLGDPDSGCLLPETAEDADFGDIQQFVMVERDRNADVWYDFGDTAEQLCDGAAADDSDYEPRLIVDLDSGHAHDVHVSYRISDNVSGFFRPATTV